MMFFLCTSQQKEKNLPPILNVPLNKETILKFALQRNSIEKPVESFNRKEKQVAMVSLVSMQTFCR